MRILIFVIVSIVAAAACSPKASDPDREVLIAVLTHFHQRQDLQGVSASGFMLLEPDTHVWSRQSLESLQEDRADECQIPQPLYEGLYARGDARPLGDVIAGQQGWRVATREQLAPEHLLQRLSDQSIRTLVSVSKAGFSKDGRQAAVVLSFTTGVHGALARYRLARASGGWSIACSQLNYYL